MIDNKKGKKDFYEAEKRFIILRLKRQYSSLRSWPISESAAILTGDYAKRKQLLWSETTVGICHPVVVAQRNKEWIIKIAIILKRIMPKPTGIRVHHHNITAPTIIWPIIMQPTTMASAQMIMRALNKLRTLKCASFALKFYMVNCIVSMIRQKQTSPMKPSK